MKLALAVLALSSSVLAQTPPPAAPAPAPAKSAKPATTNPTHHAASSTATPSALPKVVGLPHTLYTLKYIDTKIGTGELPPAFRFYTVNYTGYLPDGTKFDSTIDPAFKHATPFTFPYGGHRVITGWDTGFEGMRVGGKRRLFVPYQLGYGVAGSPPKIPAKANLIFDVELVSISDKPPAPPANAAPRPTAPGSTAPGSTAPGGTAPGSAAPAKPVTPAAAPSAAPGTAPSAAPTTAPPAGTTPPPATAPATPPPASTPPAATAPDAPAKPTTPPTM